MDEELKPCPHCGGRPMEERVSKILAALDACAGRSCGHCPYTTPRTAACERMVKADAAALIRELWGEIEQKNREE